MLLRSTKTMTNSPRTLTLAGPAEQLDHEVLSLLEAQPAERATGARSISVYRLKARVAAVDGLSGFADDMVRMQH